MRLRVAVRARGTVRAALVEAGLELARAGGPDAVVLREVTRMVGVGPNADHTGISPTVQDSHLSHWPAWSARWSQRR